MVEYAEISVVKRVLFPYFADKHHITPDLTWQFSVYAFSVKIPNESGVLTLANRPFLALYSFGAHTSNSITSARVTPVVDGEAREEYSLCCARMPSGLLASASGAAPLDGARTLAFEMQTDIPARFDNSAFTVLLLYG